MPTRKKQLEELFENFQVIKRSLMNCPKNMHKTHRITPSQWMVLRMIDQKKETTVKTLAGILSISSSATTQLVDALVKKGYISRKESPKDRRSILLNLTLKTKKKFAGMKKEAIQQLSEIFKVLTNMELEKYLELNKKITLNLK